MKRVVVATLQAYRRWISPALSVACRYVPTCSEYAIEAVEHYGVFRGGLKAMGRLLRCHPFVKGGFDPVEKDVLGPRLVHSHLRISADPKLQTTRPYLVFRRPDLPSGQARKTTGER